MLSSCRNLIVQCPCSSLHSYMHPLSLYFLQKYYFADIHIVSYSKLVAKWRGGKIKLLNKKACIKQNKS